MLSPYRVLDLTDARAELATMIMASLGADVIKVEPPGGSASRLAEPVDANQPEGLQSLRFQVQNRGKRSVALDLDSPVGQEQFRELSRGADFIFENDEPGRMASRGIGYDRLREDNPLLVYVAISPFGQDGPYAKHAATDLTLAAMGGMMALNGDADRRPIRVTVPQTWYHAAVESVVGALVAHRRRLTTGEPQHVDVSVQAAVFWTGLQAMIAHSIQGADIERAGTDLQLGTTTLPCVFECKDGAVVLVPTEATIIPMLDWMLEEGVVDQAWVDAEDWTTFELRFLTAEPLAHELSAVIAKMGEYIKLFTKTELLQRGLRDNVTIAPVSTLEDVLGFQHLDDRGYWDTVSLAGGRGVKMPGRFLNADKPLKTLSPAPAAGEHTEQVLGQTRHMPPVETIPAESKSALPFEGIKVADFSWIGVGPITAKYLADHGAEVIRVETSAPVDRLRVLGPFKDGEFGHNRSQFFGAFNTSKKSLSVDLKNHEGQGLAMKLIDWADVVLDSFTAGTMNSLGIGWEWAHKRNPGLIMATTCLMGQSGPASSLAGYGYHAAAIAGFYNVTGWPDRSPAGPFTAYTDTIAPRFLGAALMAAIDHQRRTGEGQFIDQAQIESALHFLGPEIVEYQVSGAIPSRAGNDQPNAAPHDAFPCAGDDEWVAIAVESNDQWQSLIEVLGNPGWARDASLATGAGRFAAREAIYPHIAEWTEGQDKFAAMEHLQAAGVPAGAVQRSHDHQTDPQLAHRNFFHPMEHGEMGLVPYEGHQFNISGYPSGPRWPSPLLGDDSFRVISEVLGIGGYQAATVIASGAIV